MAITNYDRVGKAMEHLKLGLSPFVLREFKNKYKDAANQKAQAFVGETAINVKKDLLEWDVAALLKLIWESWGEVFKDTLGFSEKNLVSELRNTRNKWAHQENFTGDDADRALDSIYRLLSAVTAPEAEEVNKMKQELRRLIYDEQVRGEKRKAGGSLVEGASSGNIKPWREVVTPHQDVASGRYQQAEFAADLWQVHLGEGTDEYRKPSEFFRRTYLTESLKQLLIGGVKRLSGTGGDPVIQLQTNFGGGKTHSMLALYHLFSGTNPNELAGVDAVLAEAGVKNLPKAKRVVLVGNKISPGNPVTKKDGTVVRTLWGELAYQLGGKKAYAKIAADDEKATNPGDALRELFIEHGPCLVLIDEWVAYARQLHENSDLPAGNFETQFTFAQALTESAKLAKNCLLVISLPASDTTGSPHTQTDDVEVGGVRGREALDRLRNVIGRVESSWRPASAEEGFEIVRRRLFEPFNSQEQFKQRDVTARAFMDWYKAQAAEFPPECRESDYEKRIQAAYPIHPEIFDRLYNDWSTLVKFQRTRGVLRLMASVIHSLWEKGDKNPLILPSTIPLDDKRVQFELTRYLSDNWTPIIEKDIDGPNSLPLKIDSEVPNLGKLHATRRVARTVYLGSAPTSDASHKGVEDRTVKLGCVMPGESPAIFGDALRRLSSTATFLYHDGSRVWYSTHPTVTKLAEDRAEQINRDQDKIAAELDKRLRTDLRKDGEFARIHILPKSNSDIPDDMEARLVVLGAEHPYIKETNNPAEAAAKSMLENRGTTPRLYRNTLAFLAPDKARLQDLDEAICKYLAWESIINETQALDLSPFQFKQAETQKKAADAMVLARLPEAYQWLIVPTQNGPQGALEWLSLKLSGNEPLAVRANKKLKNEELLITNFAATRLKMELDRIPLWRGDYVMVKQLVEDFSRYLYLPRVAGPKVIARSIEDGLGMTSWDTDSFAIADDFDQAGGRYRGLKTGQIVQVTHDDTRVVVKPKLAQTQLAAEAQIKAEADGQGAASGKNGGGKPSGSTPPGSTTPGATAQPPGPALPKRYYGSVKLDPTRVGRDAGKIAEEVISHITGLVGSDVTVTLEIDAKIPNGAPDNVVRTVTENSRTLNFKIHGFEKE
jgi:predicted AAA+ superfamily ATPase